MVAFQEGKQVSGERAAPSFNESQPIPSIHVMIMQHRRVEILCSCLHISVQFVLHNSQIAHKIACCKSSLRVTKYFHLIA